MSSAEHADLFAELDAIRDGDVWQTPFDKIKQVRSDNTEYWSARSLMLQMGYAEWRKFEDAIERARASADAVSAGQDHFVGAAKMINLGKGGKRKISDVHLTRYGAYLVAMNGDPRKAEVAAAQTYFASQTYYAEERQRADAKPEVNFDMANSISRKEMALAILAAEEALEETRRELETVKPAAEAWEGFVAPNLGDLSFAEAAAALTRAGIQDMGQNRLFRVLGVLGWIVRTRRNHWRPMQRFVDSGLLVNSVYRDRQGILRTQVRITPKGLDRIYRDLRNSVS